jgi:hypothetical protein
VAAYGNGGGQLTVVIPDEFRLKGAAGNGVANDLPALRAAIDACGKDQGPRGGLVFIPPGEYRLSGDLVVDRHMIIRGCASAGNYASTKLVFDEGYGVVIATHADWGNPGTSRCGERATLEDLYIFSAGNGRDPPRAPVPGVRMRSAAQLYRCGIVGFGGQGIWIDSFFNSPLNQQVVNDFIIDSCWVENNQLWGMFAGGMNSQAGNIIATRFISNGLGGFYDSSFLGNTYTGCHVESNLFPAAKGRAFVIDGGVNRSTVTGCYTESDLLPAHVDSNAVVIGGTHGAGFTPESTGIRIVEGTISPTVVAPGAGPITGRDRLLLGRHDGTGVLGWQAAADDTHTSLGYQGDPLDSYHGCWVLGRDNLRLLAFPGPTAAAELRPGSGRPAFPLGTLLGSSGGGLASMTGLSAAAGPPSTGAHAPPEYVLNAAPAPGGVVGWVCVAAGTPGTWKPWGLIAS